MCFAKTVLHHLSPDGKKNPHHHHVLLQSTVPKRQSAVTGPVSITKDLALMSTIKDGQKSEPSGQDPHSTVCIIA